MQIISKEQLSDDIGVGLKITDISVKYNCSPSTISRFVKIYGLVFPRRRTKRLRDRQFGRLKVLEEDHSKNNGSWICECICGNKVSVKSCHLLSGGTISCGCYLAEIRQQRWKGFGEISGNYWNQVNRHAKQRGFLVEISIEEAWNKFLCQNRSCALTGLPLNFYRNAKKEDQTASIDRKNSKLGYTIENIQWIHKIVQKMKWDLDEEQFFEFCKLIVERKCQI